MTVIREGVPVEVAVPALARRQMAAPAGALGVNFNARTNWINHNQIRRVNAQWIRAFLDMHALAENPREDTNVQNMLAAIDAGFKTILSLKWDYSDKNFPDRDTDERKAEMKRLGSILEIFMGKVDILVIGNEPFIESKQTGPRLPGFYQHLANFTIEYQKKNPLESSSTRLYMGAFNRLDQEAKRTPAVEQMLEYIKSKPEIAGVDLHLHMGKFQQHKMMLDYVLPKIRDNQYFIATEFSMIWHWKNNMNQPASTAFCEKHSLTAGSKVYEVLNEGIKTPFTVEKWEEFLKNEPWYMEHQNFICDAMSLYRGTGRLDVATHCFVAMRERTKPFQETDVPWMLNSLVTPSMVQKPEKGPRHENFPWAEQFRKAVATN